MPKMAKSMKMKRMKAETCTNLGIALIKVVTSFFIFGIAFIDLKGLSTLKILSALRPESADEKNSSSLN